MGAQDHIFYSPPPPFLGGRQPYEGRKLSPALIPAPPAPDNPPFTMQGRQVDQVMATWNAWYAAPWSAQTTIKAVPAATPDQPPSLQGGPVWVWYDDGIGWIYTMRRTMSPALIPAPPTPNNPPFAMEGRQIAQVMAIWNSWYPPPWPSQKTRKSIPPAPPAPDNPPFVFEGRQAVQQYAVAISWLPPAPRPSFARPRVIPPPDNPPFVFEGRQPVQQYAVAIAWLPGPPRPYFPGSRVIPPNPPAPTPVTGGGRRRLFRRN